jgi:octaprenyl-diphosphate synthase
LYGIDTAITSGSWLFFEALSCINGFPGGPETAFRLYRAAAAETRRLHLGQAMDIAWHRDNSRVPSVTEYLSMTRLKTGTLASLAGKLGVLGAGGTEEEAERFGEIAAGAGVGFQVLDDVLNLTRGNPGKKRGDDIVEGKKSLPVLFHLDSRPEDFRRIAGYFEAAKRNGIDAPEVEQCVTLLNESGAVEQAQAYGEGLIRSVCGTLRERWPGNEAAGLIAGMFEAMTGEAAR